MALQRGHQPSSIILANQKEGEEKFADDATGKMPVPRGMGVPPMSAQSGVYNPVQYNRHSADVIKARTMSSTANARSMSGVESQATISPRSSSVAGRP
ncbi:MAG: hypothetical protein AB7O62_17895, partial [Pirellulales bacterium]